jgi:hypothetical protein
MVICLCFQICCIEVVYGVILDHGLCSLTALWPPLGRTHDQDDPSVYIPTRSQRLLLIILMNP